MEVYNKQYKRVFTIKYIDDRGYAIDELGIQHDLKALRAVKESDLPSWRI